MRRLADLPLVVPLIGVGGLAMLVPALFAAGSGAVRVAGAFAQGAMLLCTAAGLLGLALAWVRPRNRVRAQFLSLVGAYFVLPPLLALPLVWAMPGLPFGFAWFEMVSSFTTTGATVFDRPRLVPDAVHLWRALVGWLGGFLVLLVAVALLAPLNLGGLEVESGRPPGRDRETGLPTGASTAPVLRFRRGLSVLAPLYGAGTLALWVGLQMAGERPFVALCHAMSVIATSGISPVGGIGASAAGMPGEALLLGFMVFAVTRRSLPGRVQPEQRRRLVRDPELRLALALVLVLSLVLFLRHWLIAPVPEAGSGAADAGRAVWGSLFTLTSFLTTTGFVSADWPGTLAWSGLSAPGLLLAGLVLVGGGVATTAGGIKLLRIHALWRHGRHEMEKLLQPSLVAGGGERVRHLRSDGAYLAWLAFMLFVLSLAGVTALLGLAGLDFEQALVLAIAGLSTTGPLAGMAGDPALGYAGLADAQRMILAAAMLLGRLELLAIVVLLAPESWRR